MKEKSANIREIISEAKYRSASEEENILSGRKRAFLRASYVANEHEIEACALDIINLYPCCVACFLKLRRRLLHQHVDENGVQ